MKKTLLISVLSAVAVASQASVVQFSDRAAFITALGQETSIKEDFNGFLTDTEFRSAPVAFNGGSLKATAGTNDDVNLIDAPSFSFGGTDIDGTTFALVATDFESTEVRMDFSQATIAFGAQFRGAAGGEFVSIDIYNGGTLLDTINIDDNLLIFRGFIVSGDSASHLIFRSTTQDQSLREAFGMDNVEMEAVPEPMSLGLLAAGALALARRRKSAH